MNSNIRIIGGQWRGRKLSVIDADGLRPTGSRIRETLFNWLAPWLSGSRCLDLFAGTGALGLEALSRGAGQVQFAESNIAATRQLQENLTRLECTQGQVYAGDALQLLLNSPSTPCDIVFLDPPFAQALWQPTLDALLHHQWLHDQTLVYIESPRDTVLPISGWTRYREKASGAVRYGLYCPAKT